VTDRGVRQLPFALHLAKFEIETYDQQKDGEQAKKNDGSNALLVALPEKNLRTTLPVRVDVEQQFGQFKITVLKYIPDFVVDMTTKEVTTRSPEPRNPAILVAVNGPNYQNHRWLFAKFPDFVMPTKDDHATGPSPLRMVYQNLGAAEASVMPSGPIKSFKSTFDVIDGGRAVVQDRTLEVNRPFSYKGYTFYQSGYNPQDLTYTSFQVSNDPGVPVVYAGFTLMITGLFIVFYLNPWLANHNVAAPLPQTAAASRLTRLTGARAGVKPAATEQSAWSRV
jgi:hypothetical protein